MNRLKGFVKDVFGVVVAAGYKVWPAKGQLVDLDRELYFGTTYAYTPGQIVAFSEDVWRANAFDLAKVEEILLVNMFNPDEHVRGADRYNGKFPNFSTTLHYGLMPGCASAFYRMCRAIKEDRGIDVLSALEKSMSPRTHRKAYRNLKMQQMAEESTKGGIVAKAGKSFHGTGNAIDMPERFEPIWEDGNLASWFVDYLQRYGFVCNRITDDTPHIEYIGPDSRNFSDGLRYRRPGIVFS